MRRSQAPIEPRPQPRSGEVIGRYTVLSLLGRGGMGAVYRAYDPWLDRNVALKLLHRATRDQDPASELRLLREAQMLAQLQHPNIVAVYDAGSTDRGVFVAMELCEGRTLGEWLAERRRTVSEILAVFRAAGRGLDAAHEAGLVHRDFKPSNVLVGEDGSVRVLDFGVAGSGEPPSAGIDTGRCSRREVTRPEVGLHPPTGPIPFADLTEDDVVIGTPRFMAPEQLVAGKIDHRSDQFTFCVCLHEALYGSSPVLGRTFSERRRLLVRGQVLDEHALLAGPRPRAVPKRVRRALLRGLSVDPSARFESMRALVAALEPVAWRRLARVGLAVLLGFGAGTGVTTSLGSWAAAEPLATSTSPQAAKPFHAMNEQSGSMRQRALERACSRAR